MGERLFHDATLSHQGWQSCGSCQPDGRADALNWDLLNDGIGNPKNTKSLVASHNTPPVMSLGVRAKAEQAVRTGFRNILFHAVKEKEASAVDAYLRTLEPVPSPLLVGGELSEAARRGKRLFSDPQVWCVQCHPPPLFTDLRPYDVGTATGRDGRTTAYDTPTLITGHCVPKARLRRSVETSVRSGGKAALHAAVPNLAGFERASDFTAVFWSTGRNTAFAAVRGQEGFRLPGGVRSSSPACGRDEWVRSRTDPEKPPLTIGVRPKTPRDRNEKLKPSHPVTGLRLVRGYSAT